MQFNSVHFVFFFPVVFALHWLLPFRYRWLLLLAASYYFYAICNPLYALLLIGTTVIDWYAALRIEKAVSPTGKKTWLLLSVLSNLLVLAGFKYSVFFWNSFAGASNQLFDSSFSLLENIVIPAGLSFYTFQSMSYTIDVYRGKAAAEPSAARFALFVSFFPQLVAGPVERYADLRPQFDKDQALQHRWLVEGLRLLTWGFFKKIAVADRLAEFVNPVFAAPGHYHSWTLLIIAFFFVVQIYCDLSGYTDIARGTAKMLGYDLQLNFKRPLFSRSAHEYWSRNHLSITHWFRDYVYIPLGGNRRSRPRWVFNLFITFVISGLWHGASWNFILWGALYGLYYVAELPFRNLKRPALLHLPAWALFMLLHALIMVAFRAGGTGQLWQYYAAMARFEGSFGDSIRQLRELKDLFPLLLAVLAMTVLFAREFLQERGQLQQKPFYERHLRPLAYVFLFVLLFLIGQFSTNEFIYFHF